MTEILPVPLRGAVVVAFTAESIAVSILVAPRRPKPTKLGSGWAAFLGNMCPVAMSVPWFAGSLGSEMGASVDASPSDNSSGGLRSL